MIQRRAASQRRPFDRLQKPGSSLTSQRVQDEDKSFLRGLTYYRKSSTSVISSDKENGTPEMS